MSSQPRSAPLPYVGSQPMYATIEREAHSDPIPGRARYRDDSLGVAFGQWPGYVRWFRNREVEERDIQTLSEERLAEAASEGLIYDPEKEKQLLKLKTTPFETSINLVKCVVGAGSFLMPHAFKESGIAAGGIALALLTLVAGYTTLQLVQCKRFLNTPRWSYSELGYHSYGTVMSLLIKLATVGAAIGGCSVYASVCSTLLADVAGSNNSETIIWYLFPFLLLLSLLRNFRYLAFTSILGDVSLIIGLVTVVYDGVSSPKITSPADLPQFNPDTFPKFFGVAAFLFCIQFLALPLEQSMREPAKFTKPFTGVLPSSFTFCMLLNLAFGVAGYCFYGDSVQPLVISNVAPGTFTDLVKILLCADLLFTYPVVMVAPRDIVEGLLIPKHWLLERDAVTWPEFFTSRLEWARNLTRLGLVLLSLGLALGVPNLDNIVNFNGGIWQTFIAFMAPPLIHMHVFGKNLKWYHWVIDVCLVGGGLALAIICTKLNIETL